MPTLTPTALDRLEKLAASQRKLLLRHFPKASLYTELEQNQEPSKHSISQEVVQQERQAILEKLRSLAGQTNITLESDELLYLEQQLCDLLGFSVTAQLDNHRLTHLTGTIQAQPHLHQSFNDRLTNHPKVAEAGLNPKRGFFGWLPASQESYFLTAQLQTLDDWRGNRAKLSNWFKWRKVIAINPTQSLAVVAVLADLGPVSKTAAQFGGSPELIREGLFWQPLNRGVASVWFVDDPHDQIKLGPIAIS